MTRRREQSQERHEIQAVAMDGMMATLCKDGGRQARPGRSLTYLGNECRGLAAGWVVEGRNLQPVGDEPVTRNAGSLSDATAGRILNAGQMTMRCYSMELRYF